MAWYEEWKEISSALILCRAGDIVVPVNRRQFLLQHPRPVLHPGNVLLQRQSHT